LVHHFGHVHKAKRKSEHEGFTAREGALRIGVVDNKHEGRDTSNNKAVPDHPFKEIVGVAAVAPQTFIAHLVYFLLFFHSNHPHSLLSVSPVLTVPADKSEGDTDHLKN